MSPRLAGLLCAAALAVGGAACGDDETPSGSTTTAAGAATTGGAPGETTTTAGGEPTTSTAGEATGPSFAVLFPGGDDRVDDPVDAAEGFMETYFPGVTYALDEFQQGDTSSGELSVRRIFENGAGGSLASTLLLRQEGGSWFVTAAVHPSVVIGSPEPGATVGRGVLVVEGSGRGFEGTIVVTAYVVGGGGVAVDLQPGQGGSFEASEPFEVQLDLAAAEPGTTLALVAQGAVGLEDDPGEFAAVPVVVAP